MNLYLLGVGDPEMRRMAAVLEHITRELGTDPCFVYATKDGKPVHPGNAYQADPVDMGKFDTLVCVECRPATLPDGAKVIVVDHHRPGDPGYEMGSSQFWEASSLGQLYKLLGLTPTNEDLALAAMDHCFPAAIRGECPGVSPEQVLAVKVAEVANGTKSNEDDVRAKVADYKTLLHRAPEITIGTQVVKDLRGVYLGEGYTLDLLAAQIAATINRCTAVLRHRDRADAPEKNSITGNTEPATVEAFMREWAPSQGLVRVYGVPDRGYAGGYVS